MSDHDMTPERLDGILDGSIEATDQADRDLLALAAALREAAPGAPESLREKVAALPATAPTISWWRRLMARRHGWALVGAPVAAGLVAVLIAGGVLFNTDQTGDTSGAAADTALQATSGSSATEAGKSLSADTTSAAQESTPPTSSNAFTDQRAGQGPPIVRVPQGSLQERLNDARRIVEDAGGEFVQTERAPDGPGVLVLVTVPVGRGPDVAQQLGALGTSDGPLPVDADVGIRAIFVEDD